MFPNWKTSLPNASWQMTGHALLSTNFNTYTPTCQVGVLATCWAHMPEVWGLTPRMGVGFFNL